jgi:hypothetical protein
VQPLFPWKSNKYCIIGVCVYRLRYPVCNAHAPYSYLWPLPFYNALQHYLINGTLKKSLLNTKCVLISSTNFSETFVILRSSEREMIKIISYDLHEKYPNINFQKKSVHWETSCFMRTDGETDMTKLILPNVPPAPKS